jgi:enolase-phosphatase E1
MIRFAGSVILFDVEGTVTPVHFLTGVLVPYARRELPGFLAKFWGEPVIAHALEQVAHDAGAASFADWAETESKARQHAKLIDHLKELMDADAKAAGLKELEGLVWGRGIRKGWLQAPVYPDVPAALREWSAKGIDVRVFSSGSVGSQKVFFGHTDGGDLLPYLCGHYDTTTGPKGRSGSYRAIAADVGRPPDEVLFLSDLVVELDAAARAGLKTALVVRGDAGIPVDPPHPIVTSFAEITLEGAHAPHPTAGVE